MHLLKNITMIMKKIWYLKQEIFNKLIHEKRDELLKLSQRNNYDDLTYRSKGKNIAEKSFNDACFNEKFWGCI